MSILSRCIVFLLLFMFVIPFTFTIMGWRDLYYEGYGSVAFLSVISCWLLIGKRGLNLKERFSRRSRTDYLRLK